MRSARLHRLTRPAAVAAAALLLGACGGGGDASQGNVQDRVEELLLDEGYQGADLSGSQAEDGARCVATGLFGSDEFSKDDRNAVANASDGDVADPDLVARFQTLVDGCMADVLEVGPAAPTGGGGDEGDSDG